jgi:hypothetical protein
VSRTDEINRGVAVSSKDSSVATQLADWSAMAEGAFSANTLWAWRADCAQNHRSTQCRMTREGNLFVRGKNANLDALFALNSG